MCFVKKQTTILMSMDIKKRLLEILRTREDEIGSRLSYAQIIEYLIECYERDKVY